MERELHTNVSIEQLQAMMADLIVSQMETDQKFQATDKKFQATDKKFQATDKKFQETNKQIKENDRILIARFKELSKQIGGIGNSNGDFAEDFFYNGFDATMQVGDIKYDYIQQNKNKKIKNLQGEYDIVLTNGNSLLVIEVKYKLKKNQVLDFYEKKLPKFRKLFPEFNDYSVHAAMAAMSFEKNTKEEVIKKGMLLFTQSGDNLTKISPKEMIPTEF